MARGLSLEDRTAAQMAIERVYWNHRIWPKENQTEGPSFEEVVPESAVRSRVEDYLSKSNALDAFWSLAISSAQLQAEMRRMAASSQQPAILADLFSALGNDPLLIAECLARPALVDRMIRNRYSRDERLHGELKAEAERALAGGGPLESIKGAHGEYEEILMRPGRSQSVHLERQVPGEREVQLDDEEWRAASERFGRRSILSRQAKQASVPGVLDAIGIVHDPLAAARAWSSADSTTPYIAEADLEEDDESFRVTRVLDAQTDSIRLATVTWRKVPFETWWQGERSRFSTAIPLPAMTYEAVPVSPQPCIDNTWQPMRSKAATGRSDHVAVWTGAEMLVWGGLTSYGVLVNGGGRYDPATDTWMPMSPGPNSPSPRIGMSAIWTGREMILWGGEGGDTYFGDGYRYDPVSDRWTVVSDGGLYLLPRAEHTAVWTGTEMIIWGGRDAYGLTDYGGRYNPSSDTWTIIPPNATSPRARYRHSAVWTGKEMIIWGGQAGGGIGGGLQNTGSRYDPLLGTWTPTNAGPGTPEPRWWHTAVWTGKEMIVWGGDNEDLWWYFGTNTGGRYDPATDTWAPTTIAGAAPIHRRFHSAVWTGTEMIVWGGITWDVFLPDGGRYDPTSDSWVYLPYDADKSPSPRAWHTALWTGTEMILWGGFWGGGLDTGGRYDPLKSTWTPTGTGAEIPSDRNGHTAVWTGSEMIVWGGYNTDLGYFNTGGRYNPATDSWTPTSVGADFPYRTSWHSAVWTGREMIVWGGDSPYPRGGRYDPILDTWTPTSTRPMVPEARSGHSAIWTGNEMIVWGGRNYSGVVLDSGARYNPSIDAWSTTGTAGGPPSPRNWHSSVWTGREMIVWGGQRGDSLNPSDPIVFNDTGGRYDPLTDSWTSMAPSTQTPTPRGGHSALWTGTRMIVWGGFDGESALNSGGVYDPTTDSWTSMVPRPGGGLYSHTAVWTGREMIAWGGGESIEALSQDGGRYDPAADSWTPTSQGDHTPSPRISHTAVATGREMIVWGGYGGSLFNGGRRYCYDSCVPSSWYRDADGDGYGDPGWPAYACSRPDGFVDNAVDCDDRHATTHPGAPEICLNRRDDDCDGSVDQGCPATCADDDGDHFDVCMATCTPALDDQCGECDDADPLVHPGAQEVCDGRDQDCDGTIDDGVDVLYYRDQDGDGWGDSSQPLRACAQPSGYVTRGGDNCPSIANSGQVDANGDGTGDACDFIPILPADGTVLSSTATPPTFSWIGVGMKGFRVEFSIRNNPFLPYIRTANLGKAMRYKPSKKRWRRMRRMWGDGEWIYWRIVTRATGQADWIPSDRTFSFAFQP